MNDESNTHLDSELLQALAGGELDTDRIGPARAHLDRCGRCRAELEGWELLFGELQELPDMGPTPEFSEQVMARVQIREPLWERVRGLLPSLLRGRGSKPSLRHLSVDGIEDFLGDRLGLRNRRRVEQHLAACNRCRSHVKEWTPVLKGLQNLPRLTPSAGFAEAVMARVPVAAVAVAARQTEAAEPWGTRALGWARGLVPSTRKGWAVLGGLTAPPAVAVVAAVAAVFLHPLLSFQNLLTFAGWRAVDVAALGWVRVLEIVTGSPLALQAWEGVSVLFQSPGAAAAGLGALWASVVLSAWILYRHVIVPSLSADNHA